MASSARSPVAAFALCLAAAGCEPEIVIDARQVAAGTFRALGAFQAGGESVLAVVRKQGSAQELLLLRPAIGAVCSIGPVTGYGVPPMVGHGGLVVAFVTDASGGGSLQAYDTSCQPVAPPVEVHSPLAMRPLPGAVGTGERFLVWSYDGPLYLIDQSAATVARLGEQVRAFTQASEQSLWIADGGELVLRNLSGEEQRRLGTNVSELSWTWQGSSLYVDDQGLALLVSPTAEPQRLALDACQVSGAYAGEDELVCYLSPCAEGQLVVHDLGSGTRTTVASEVTAYRPSIDPLFYVTGMEAGHSIGQLWWSDLVEPPRPVADQADLWSMRPDYVGTTPYYLALTELDGGEGQLVRIDRAGSTEPWQSGVHAFDEDGDWVAALADLDGDTGTLHLHNVLSSTSEVVAQGVPEGGFRFSLQASALGYLRESVAGAGTLSIRVLGGDQVEDLDSGVTEFVEVQSDEAPGVAYIVGSGQRAGVWLAAVELDLW